MTTLTAAQIQEAWFKLSVRAAKLGITEDAFRKLRQQIATPDRMTTYLDAVQDYEDKLREQQRNAAQGNGVETATLAGGTTGTSVGQATQQQQQQTVTQPTPAQVQAAGALSTPADDSVDETVDSSGTDLQKAATVGIIAGLSALAMQQGLQMVLQQALTSLLTLGQNEAQSAFNQMVNLTMSQNPSLVSGWIWVCGGGACIACLEMDGSVHGNDENMDSHINCKCIQAAYNGPLPEDFLTGDQWFNQQSDLVQEEILGPSKYLAWKAGDVQLMDFIDHSDGYVSERSLKSLGLDYKSYLDGVPRRSDFAEIDAAMEEATAPLREVEAFPAELEDVGAFAPEFPEVPEVPSVPPEPTIAEAPAAGGDMGLPKLTYTLPEIDQEAEAAIIQQAQDVLSGGGVASQEDILALGQPIHDYLDERIGPLADWAADANKIYNTGGKDLSGDLIGWLHGDTTDHGGFTIQQALEQYQAASRQETIRLLDQVRGVGDTELEIADGAPAALEDMLHQVEDAFPTDWLDASNEDGTLTVLDDPRRGFYRSNTQDAGGTIGLNNNDQTTPGQLYTAAVHELGHRMEDAIDGVWQAERDFYEARTAKDAWQAIPAAFKVAGRTKVDDFANAYLGKDPIHVIRGAGLPPVEHYELLSSGLEYVLGTDYRGAWNLSRDEEYHQFILGLLFGAKGGA